MALRDLSLRVVTLYLLFEYIREISVMESEKFGARIKKTAKEPGLPTLIYPRLATIHLRPITQRGR